MDMIGRAKGIIMQPAKTWTEIKEETTTISDLYKSYAVILAAIPAIAQFIGYGLIGYSVLGIHIQYGIGRAIGYAILYYILSLVGIYIVAFVADALAPNFGSKKNIINAFKAVTYSMTPSWIGGIFYIIPSLSPLAILAGLYSLYLFYLGLPNLMETPKEKSIGYVVVVIVVTIVVYIVIGAVVGGIFTPAMY